VNFALPADTYAALERQAQAREAPEARASEWCPHRPQAKQRQFLELDCQEGLYGGAASGGKSDALLMDALADVDQSGYAAILFRRTYTELMLPEAIMARSHEWLGGTKAHWNGSDKQWRFPTGSSLSFGYLDGPNDHLRYQSAAFQFIGWDELTQFPERPYRYLFSRLRRLAGSKARLRVRSATNPGGPGHEWVKNRFGIPDDVDFARVYSHQGRVFVPARRTDNRHVDQESYSAALAELDTVTRDQLEHGRWVRDTSGLVYSDWHDELVIDALPQLPEGERWHHLLACDFGVVDPTAFAVLSWNDYDPACYVVEAEQWPDLAPSEAAEVLQSWQSRYGRFVRIVGDVGGLGKAYEAEFRKRFAISMEVAEKANKLGFIKLLNGDLKHGAVKFLSGPTDQLVDDVKRLPWKDEKCQAEHPDAPNHLPDALLYGWRFCRHYRAETRPKKLQPGTPAAINAEMAELKQQHIRDREKRQRQERIGRLCG
jgi:hypothetical protein